MPNTDKFGNPITSGPGWRKLPDIDVISATGMNGPMVEAYRLEIEKWREQIMQEVRNEKAMTFNYVQVQNLGLKQVERCVTFVFDDFTPQRLADAYLLFGVPENAVAYITTDWQNTDGEYPDDGEEFSVTVTIEVKWDEEL